MGLLDKFNRGMSAIETGLLGNATAFNPQLAQYLSPGTQDRANKDARMQLGLAMLAASESGMGFGQGLMMAQQMAGQAFRQPLEQDLQGNMQIQALEKIKRDRERQAAQARVAQQYGQYGDLLTAAGDEAPGMLLEAELRPPGEEAEQWRPLTNEEIQSLGLPPGIKYQVNNAGKIDEVGTRPPVGTTVINNIPAPTEALPPNVQEKINSGVAALRDLDTFDKVVGRTGRVKGIVPWAQAYTGLGADEAIQKAETARRGMKLAVQSIIPGIPSNFDVKTAIDTQFNWTNPEGLNVEILNRQKNMFRDLIGATLAYYKGSKYIVPPELNNIAKRYGVDTAWTYEGGDPYEGLAKKYPEVKQYGQSPITLPSGARIKPKGGG